MQPDSASLHAELQPKFRATLELPPTELQSAPGHRPTLQKGPDRPYATDELIWRERERTRESQQEAMAKRQREQQEGMDFDSKRPCDTPSDPRFLARQAMDTRLRELDPESLPDVND